MTIAVRVVSVALTLLLLVPAGVEARTHHVDSSGSDADAGTRTAPFATVHRAAEETASGDTVLIGGGVCELERPRRRAA